MHINGSTDAALDGSRVLYYHKDDEVLAQAIYDVMYPALKETASLWIETASSRLTRMATPL